MALLLKKVDFQYIEQDPYVKTADWLAINPRGLVPAMVHHGKTIYESAVCLEYIEDVWTGEPSLFPKEPYSKAYARMWGDFIAKKLVPAFYTCLVKQREEEQAAAKQQILDGLLEFSKAMDETGPFFHGDSLGYTDIMFAPWAVRIPVALTHYRSFDVPRSREYDRYHKWFDAVRTHHVVVQTTEAPEDILKMYKKYASDSATSQVADAIRSGKALP